jgi:sugar lactone lactonase YvrE
MTKRKGAMVAACLLVAAIAYLLAWPVPVSPLAWPPPAAATYQGPFAVNRQLAGLSLLSLGGERGPEHVLARDGWLYVAVDSGAILRLRPDGSAREVVVRTGGRPLGFAFASDGSLVIADPLAGKHGGLWLHRVGRAAPELLADEVAGTPIAYADAVVVGDDGNYYFTDASQRFGARAWGGTFRASVLDLIEQRCTGRVLVHEPANRRTAVVMDDLCFANGIELSADGRKLYVAETGRYRIWEVPRLARGLSARQPAGGARVLVDHLPGYPDNLTRGEEGRYWVGLVKPRSAFLDAQAGRPWLRAMALRLPEALWPVPPAYGHVFAFDASGRVVASLQDPAGSYPSTTGLTEAFGRRYVQSLHADALGSL